MYLNMYDVYVMYKVMYCVCSLRHILHNNIVTIWYFINGYYSKVLGVWDVGALFYGIPNKSEWVAIDVIIKL